MYNAFGGTLIDDQGGLADLTSGDNLTAMTEMLDFYKYLIGNGYTQENLKLKDYRSSFGAGNVVMYVDQSWGYAQISEVSDSTSDFTVTASLPGTMGTNGKGESLVESHCFMIGSSLSDTQKEAVDLFIQYCTSTGTMEDYLNNIGLAYVVIRVVEIGVLHYLRFPSWTACAVSCVTGAVLSLAVNLIALRRIDHLNLTNVSSN